MSTPILYFQNTICGKCEKRKLMFDTCVLLKPYLWFFIERWHLCLFADGHKHKKSLRRKLDSLSKEKGKDKGNVGCAGYFPHCWGRCCKVSEDKHFEHTQWYYSFPASDNKELFFGLWKSHWVLSDFYSSLVSRFVSLWQKTPPETLWSFWLKLYRLTEADSLSGLNTSGVLSDQNLQ